MKSARGALHLKQDGQKSMQKHRMRSWMDIIWETRLQMFPVTVAWLYNTTTTVCRYENVHGMRPETPSVTAEPDDNSSICHQHDKMRDLTTGLGDPDRCATSRTLVLARRPSRLSMFQNWEFISLCPHPCFLMEALLHMAAAAIFRWEAEETKAELGHGRGAELAFCTLRRLWLATPAVIGGWNKPQVAMALKLPQVQASTPIDTWIFPESILGTRTFCHACMWGLQQSRSSQTGLLQTRIRRQVDKGELQDPQDWKKKLRSHYLNSATLFPTQCNQRAILISPHCRPIAFLTTAVHGEASSYFRFQLRRVSHQT